MLFRKRRNHEPAEDAGQIELTGEWTGDIWEVRPIRVPATLDVDAFLEQRPVPPVFPDDEVFVARIGGDDGIMRRLWLMALLHHPDPDVVLGCLRSPYLESSLPHAVVVADLLIESRVPYAAAEAVWGMDDNGVHTVLTVVLGRGAVPGSHTRQQEQRALEVLRYTCPEHRRAFFEADIRDG